MQLKQSKAILLDVVDLHEYDRIASFLTADRGLLRGVAKGSRRKYSRFAGQLQPLAQVEATWLAKEGQDLVRLSSLDLVRSAEPLHRDLESILIGGYLADHMLEFAQQNEESGRLYRLLNSTIEALLAGVDRSLASRYFEVWVLRLEGVFPVPSHCPRCSKPFMEAGASLPHGEMAILCRECYPGGPEEEISDEVLAFIIRTRQQSLREMADEPPSQRALRGTETICSYIRRAFLQHELKSYRVLQQALA